MLEHAIYSVIPPESCAVILEAFGRDPSRGADAAEALRLSAQQTLALRAVDEIIPEPLGGAHRDAVEAARLVKDALTRTLSRLQMMTLDDVVTARYQKLRTFNHFVEA